MPAPGLVPESVTDVVIGNAVGGGGNVARLAALEAGLPVTVPGVTVDRQCGSGLDAIVLAARLVAAGGNGVYLAGGVESISTAPLRAHRNDDGSPEFYSRAQFAPLSLGDPDMGVAAENVAAATTASAGNGRTPSRSAATSGPWPPPPPGGSTPNSCRSLQAPGSRVQPTTVRGPSLSPALMARFPAVFVSGGTVTAGNSCFDADGAAAVVDHLPATGPANWAPPTGCWCWEPTPPGWRRSCWASAPPRRPNGSWRRTALTAGGRGPGGIQRGVRVADTGLLRPSWGSIRSGRTSTAGRWPWGTPTAPPARSW